VAKKKTDKQVPRGTIKDCEKLIEALNKKLVEYQDLESHYKSVIKLWSMRMGHPDGNCTMGTLIGMVEKAQDIIRAQIWIEASTQAVNGANSFCGVKNERMNALLEFSDYCRAQATRLMPSA